VAHQPTSAFQQYVRVGNFGAAKEPDIHMIFEGIDLAERCVTYARGRMTVMQ